jgi:hypothetical protein
MENTSEKDKNFLAASSPTPRSPPRKSVHLDSIPQLLTQEVMQCTLPPHRAPVSFSSYEDYEVHYQQFHVNRCSECGKNFPSERFLTLHIEEHHDPLMEARREKGERTVRSRSPRTSAVPTWRPFIGSLLTMGTYVVRMLRRRLREEVFHAAEAKNALDRQAYVSTG